MTRLYDMPFERRIREKYLLFGILLGMTIMSFMFGVGGIAYFVKLYILDIPYTEQEYRNAIEGNIVMHLIFLIPLIPLIFMMWFTKKAPRKHPDKEPVGLKWDWEKVKKL